MNDELRVKNNELGGKMKYRYRTDEEMKDSGVEWLDVIPKSWTRNKLKRELKFSVGSTPSTSNRSFFEGENIWVTIGDLNGKYCSESKTKLTEEALRSANMKKVPKGSLLYSFKLSVGQVAFTEKDLYTNEAIASFYPNNNSNLDFWYYALGNYLIENSSLSLDGTSINKAISIALIGVYFSSLTNPIIFAFFSSLSSKFSLFSLFSFLL